MEPSQSKEPGKKGPGRRRAPKINPKKLDHFLSKLCESAGMSDEKKSSSASAKLPHHGLVCQGPCQKAGWRAHLDIPSGILCVSAEWSTNKEAEKHRDVTLAVTFIDEHGKQGYEDIVFCDSEVRWLMETLWHAPIWESE